jgi:hypothetical protein
MKKVTYSIFSFLVLNLASYGQIQISGGGSGNVTISVLQNIAFKMNPGSEAWGYIWGVKIPNSVSSADGWSIGADLVSGSGIGGVTLGSSANASVVATTAPINYGTTWSYTTLNGLALVFEFNNDFRLVGGDTLTINQGTYERPWAGVNGAPLPQNTLINPGNTYTITKDSFFSSSETGTALNTSDISLVPEPTSLSLLAVGFGFFALARRFKRS